MASFITAAISAISASSIGSAIVRIIVAYGISRLINGSVKDKGIQDEGIRLQLQPNTTNPIPLLYGSAYYGGNITDAQLTNDNKTMWVCLTLSEHTANTRLSDGATVDTFIEEIYYNNQLITFKSDGITVDYVTNTDGTVDTNPRDLVKIYLYKNGSANPTLPSDFLGGTLPGTADTLFPGWDSNWTMSNLTFALVRIDYNRDKGITSIPDLRFKVSNTLYKPGDALYDYMINTVSGAGLSATDIDTNSLIALNNYADDEVNFYNEDTGLVETLADRYQINGIINPQQNVMANMQEIANSSGVFINYDIATGLWGVIINKDETPVLHFDDSNITSGIDVTATSLDSQFNAVELEFPSRFIQDQQDTIRINLPAEFLNDNEPENVLQIKMSMLNEPVQARELAYIELYQNRYDRIVTFATDYSKINVEAGDVITLTNDIYGFSNQTLRVIRVREIEADDGNIGVEITAQEYDATIYTAGGQPRRPRTPTEALNLPSLGIIATPDAPLVATANNNRQPSVLLTGTVPVGVVDRFEFWYSTDNWTTYNLLFEEKNANGAPFNSGTTILARSPLDAGSYRFKVRAGNEQAYSDYSASSDELVWAPVQTTDEVTENTTFSFGDLLPALGMGALAYFAYKAFEPDLLAALSDTALGQLLGIEDPADVAAAIEAAEQQANSFKIVNVGAVSLGAIVDQTLTFVAGEGITIEADDISHEITFTATGGGGAATTLNALSDTDVTSAIDGDILSYDEVEDTWVNKSLIAGTGIEIDTTSGSSITITATGEADATNAVSTIEAGGATLNAGTTSGALTITAGSGLSVTGDAATNTITITNTCCKEDNTTVDVQDAGKVLEVVELDDCKESITRPAKKVTIKTAAVPAVPVSYVYMTGAGTWYDPCYRQSVPTILIADPEDILEMELDDVKDLPSLDDPAATGQVNWIINTSTVKLRLRKVGDNEYVAIKNWQDLSGTPVAQTADYCDINDPWSRPLFTTADYPNGYEFATYAELLNYLETDASGVRFIYVAGEDAIPETTVSETKDAAVEITKHPRTCVKEVEALVSKTKVEFQGAISSDVLWLEEAVAIPIGSIIYGNYTSSYANDTIKAETQVIEQINSSRFGLNKEHTVLTDTNSYVTMYYYEDVKKTIPVTDVAEEANADYNDPALVNDLNVA